MPGGGGGDGEVDVRDTSSYGMESRLIRNAVAAVGNLVRWQMMAAQGDGGRQQRTKRSDK